MVKQCEDFVFHVNAHQKMTSGKGHFNNKVDKMTSSVDTSQRLSLGTSLISQWADEHSGCGGRDGTYD